MKYTLLAVFAGVLTAGVNVYEDQILMPLMMAVVISVVFAIAVFILVPTSFIAKKKGVVQGNVSSTSIPLADGETND